MSQQLERDYSNMVTNLFRVPEEILAQLTPLKVDLWHAASGVAGEGGEVLDEVKKICAYGRDVDEAAIRKIIKEMGDVEFYLEALRQKLGITREIVLAANMDKLGERYPGMVFTQQAANARVDMANLNIEGTVTGRFKSSGDNITEVARKENNES